MKTYTFFLKNGLTFKVKGILEEFATSNITGQITSYKFSTFENCFVVNLSEVLAIVEDIENEELNSCGFEEDR